MQKKDLELMIKISIIVPVYNMVNTINKTLDSILGQQYENLELIVMDGNSNDGTKEKLESRKEDFQILISEADNGQYAAIQKGMQLATGEIVSWLNADDIYFPWTLHKINFFFTKFPQTNWIAGLPSFLDNSGDLTHMYNNLSSRPQKSIQKGAFRKGVFGYLQQESMFYKKSLWDKVGGLNLGYKLAGDFELWTRFAKEASIVSVNIPLSGFRKDSNSRSRKHIILYENEVSEIIHKLGNKNKTIKFISKSAILNKILRLMIWKKQEVIFYSITKRQWCFEKVYRPISTISFSTLKLEI